MDILTDVVLDFLSVEVGPIFLDDAGKTGIIVYPVGRPFKTNPEKKRDVFAVLLESRSRMEDSLVPYRHVLSDVRQIISAGRNAAYAATNREMLTTCWSVGKRIVEEEQKGAERAEYGKRLIAVLAKELTAEFGSGFTDRNLSNYRQFYVYFPDPEIWHARVPNLSWTHFRSLLRVPDEDARLWYLNEASVSGWSSLFSYNSKNYLKDARTL